MMNKDTTNQSDLSPSDSTRWRARKAKRRTISARPRRWIMWHLATEGMLGKCDPLLDKSQILSDEPLLEIISPGRFFAADLLKAIMAYTILHYDLKFKRPGRIPDNLWFGSVIVPAPANVLFRKRKNVM